MFARSLSVSLATFALFALALGGCGVAGDKGLAIFHVADNWQKNVGIATGSTFPVTATRNDLLRTPLTTTSGLPSVAAMPGGSFQAVQPGPAQFQAMNGATLVDTVEFTVAKPVAISLGAWWSVSGAQAVKLPTAFALVQGGRYVGGIVLEDATGARLNHAAIAAVTCDHAQVAVVGEYVEATATVLGATTATVALTSGSGAPLQTSYDVQVVLDSAVADMQLASAQVQNGQSPPADPEKAPVNSDSGGGTTTAQSAIFALSATCALADKTPVYGASVLWSESGSGHLAALKTNGGNYAVLKSGESVTVTATVGALAKQVTLTAP